VGLSARSFRQTLIWLVALLASYHCFCRRTRRFFFLDLRFPQERVISVFPVGLAIGATLQHILWLANGFPSRTAHYDQTLSTSAALDASQVNGNSLLRALPPARVLSDPVFFFLWSHLKLRASAWHSGCSHRLLHDSGCSPPLGRAEASSCLISEHTEFVPRSWPGVLFLGLCSPSDKVRNWVTPFFFSDELCVIYVVGRCCNGRLSSLLPPSILHCANCCDMEDDARVNSMDSPPILRLVLCSGPSSSPTCCFLRPAALLFFFSSFGLAPHGRQCSPETAPVQEMSSNWSLLFFTCRLLFSP